MIFIQLFEFILYLSILLYSAWISLDKLNPLYQIKEQNARYKEEVSGENLICTMHDINTTDEIGWCLRIENYETLWT